MIVANKNEKDTKKTNSFYQKELELFYALSRRSLKTVNFLMGNLFHAGYTIITISS